MGPCTSNPTGVSPAAAHRGNPGCDHARRRFLALASGAVLCGALGSTTSRAATDRPVDVGTLADYPRDAISEKYIQHDLFVIRRQGKLFACTAVCPHKANFLLVDPQKNDRIICSGHDSKFSPEGLPQGGPARRPLIRYGISVNASGRVMVDTSREFPAARWDDPASHLLVG